ncbi:spore coat protein GerQ [Paenibacillus eucommiae]|uniref:Spore germination protein Q n=1 Tax=Paenibacillus eucommiae TaxID=1355755 RepID=A0ABS4IWS8_9BACL|nr:spore coat protein GerQ [Paenibacillus eucommiae]MBP1992045.1 spore germination protein Q [Paenibacillus eucommiae]
MMNNPFNMGMQAPYGYAAPGYQSPCQQQMPVAGASSFVPMIPAGSAIPTTGAAQTGINVPGQLPIEESFIENILRLNLGKMATIYMTYENNSQWNAKIFKGRLEAAGRDHIIISDPKTGMRYLLLMVNLDYITFDEELKYSPSFGRNTDIL